MGTGNVANAWADPSPINPLAYGDYLNLTRGNGAQPGRYGNVPQVEPDRLAYPIPDRGGMSTAVPGVGPRAYAPVDFDGSTQVPAPTPPPNPDPFRVAGAAPFRFTLPNSVTTPYPNYPVAPTGRYLNGGGGPNNDFERKYHPSIFNPFSLNFQMPGAGPLQIGTTDQNLPIPDLKQLLSFDVNYGFGANGVPGELLLNSRLGRLIPNALQASPKFYRLISPYTMDLDRMGSAPGQQFDPNYAINLALPPSQRFPQGGPTTFDALAQNWVANPNPGGDIRNPDKYFNLSDGRSHLADQGRVDLNRPLTPWPTTQQLGAAYGANEMAQANQALADRIYLAKDIFDRFTTATFGYLPSAGPGQDPLPPLTMVTAGTWAAGSPQFEAMRFLAQLAVNIVDFIDEDDFITPFNWAEPDAQANQLPFQFAAVSPQCWVFGTEMPRLVINEAYAQVQNDPNDDFQPPPPAAGYQAGGQSDPNTAAGENALPFNGVTTAGRKATKPFRVNFFVELYNPYQNDPSLPDKGAARLQLTGPNTPVYQIVMMSHVDKGSTVDATVNPPKFIGLRSVGNVDGTPQVNPNSNPPPPAANQRINLTMQSWDPDPAAQGSPPPVPIAPDKYTYLVQPAGGQYNNPSVGNATQSGGNQGFYVVGPSATRQTNGQADFPYKHTAGSQPPWRPTLSVSDDSMSATLDNATTNLPRNPGAQHDLSAFATTVLLRRLAIPYLPATNNPTQPNYNPYVTVDYIDGVQINDAILYDNTGVCDGQGTNPVRASLDQRFSYGRRQPFRGSVVSRQQPNYLPPTPVQAQNTFFYQNGQNNTATPGDPQLDSPFLWYAQMDRQVSSPMELLHVSAYKPHELTQQFIYTASGIQYSYGHRAPWFDYAQYDNTNPPQPPGNPINTRLYRCLEMLGCRDRMEGAAFAARIQGRVNLNAFWDQEIMQAVADAKAAGDPNAGNFFSQTDVTTSFGQFMQQRSPTTDAGNGGVNVPSTTPPTPTTGDRVFWPLAVPNPGTLALNPNGDPQFLPAGRGLNRTFLRDSNAMAPSLPMFNVPTTAAPQPHPYIQNEMLQKTYSHYTTRGNVFAVFVTTGFFLVRADPAVDFAGTNDQYRPPLLGSEVDTTLRHQFFAIVDRTNLTVDQNPANGARIQGNRPIFLPYAPVNGNNPLTMTSMAATEPYNPSLAVTINVPSYGMGPNGGILVRDTIDHYGRDFDQAGTNSTGEVYEILAGKLLFVDVGSRAEAAPVLNVNAALGQVTIATSFRHHAGCAVCTQQLGNPGPQPLPIDYESPPYSGVVPFRVILK
jgi:hypothetical protein